MYSNSFFFLYVSGPHFTSFLLFYLLLGVSRVPGACIHLPAACSFPISVTPVRRGWVLTSMVLEMLVFALGCSTICALKLNLLIAGFLGGLSFHLFAGWIPCWLKYAIMAWGNSRHPQLDSWCVWLLLGIGGCLMPPIHLATHRETPILLSIYNISNNNWNSLSVFDV